MKLHAIVLPIGIVALAFGAALFGDAPVARAHGTVDQATSGACTFVFGDGGSNSADLRQEFVPSVATLNAVDVCVTPISSPGGTFNVSIYTGTVGALGTLLASGTGAGPSSAAFVHIDFSPALTLTPGTKYVIRVDTANTVFWIYNAFAGSDEYPPGNSSGGTEDYRFQTYGAPPATNTPTSTATNTATSTPTNTATNTPTNTPSPTPTNTPRSSTRDRSATPTRTSTPLATRSAAPPTAVAPRTSTPPGGTVGAGGLRPPDTGVGTEAPAGDASTLLAAALIGGGVLLTSVGVALRRRRL